MSPEHIPYHYGMITSLHHALLTSEVHVIIGFGLYQNPTISSYQLEHFAKLTIASLPILNEQCHKHRWCSAWCHGVNRGILVVLLFPYPMEAK